MANPRIHYVRIDRLSPTQIRQMGAVRYAALPSLVGRTPEQDLERFKHVLEGFQYAGLVLDDAGQVAGFLIFGLHLRKFQGRKFLWAHLEDACVTPAMRGRHLAAYLAGRVLFTAMLAHPGVPIYSISPLFPPTYLESRRLGKVYVWGDPSLPSWEAGLLDAVAREIAEDRPFRREGHYVQLRVTSGSEKPLTFRDPRRMQWLEEYERFAPGWREGRVPIVLTHIPPLLVLALALRDLWSWLGAAWKRITGGAHPRG